MGISHLRSETCLVLSIASTLVLAGSRTKSKRKLRTRRAGGIEDESLNQQNGASNIPVEFLQASDFACLTPNVKHVGVAFSFPSSAMLSAFI